MNNQGGLNQHSPGGHHIFKKQIFGIITGTDATLTGSNSELNPCM